MIAKRGWEIGLLCVVTAVVCSCTAHKVREAQAVAAQADSLWQAGKMYGVDEGDSATLAMAYETMKKHSAFSRQFSEVCPFVHGTSSLCTYSHLCYQYGRLLRAKDDPVSAMRVFIDATHSCTRDFHILGRVYSNMGSICHLAGEFPLSYDMYERSADCFLKNGDTVLYYYGLNNMAYELAEQGKKDSCFAIVQDIDIHNAQNNTLLAYCCISKTEALLRSSCFDSAIAYAYQSKQYVSDISAVDLQLAQAYFSTGKKDSSVYYANKVVKESNELFEINNALYILTNDDETKDKEAIRQTASDRSDTQKLLEVRRGKMSQAVQLLEQDLTRKPDLRWLVAIVATILVISLCLLLYIFRKRRQHKLLSQQVNELATANAAVKQQHEQMVQEYTNYKQNKVEQIEQNCTILLQAEDFPKNIHWKDYNAMCEIVNGDFGKLASRLQTIYHLSEREIRLCVLVLLGISNSEQLAEMLHYGSSGIRNFKNRTAKKLGTNSIELRKILLNIAVGEIQKTDK